MYVLSEPELRLREELESAVKTGFVLRGEALSEVGKLDEAAMWVLRGLEKLEHSQLNSLEEKLLRVLEEEYLGRTR